VGRLRSTRRVDPWDDNLVVPTALAARAAVLAIGDELMDLKLPNDSDSQWLSQAGRDSAAAYQLPRVEAVLRQKLQCLKPSRALAKARAHHRSARARYDGPRACWRPESRKSFEVHLC
jgi:hypothetical protein